MSYPISMLSFWEGVLRSSFADLFVLFCFGLSFCCVSYRLVCVNLYVETKMAT